MRLGGDVRIELWLLIVGQKRSDLSLLIGLDRHDLRTSSRRVFPGVAKSQYSLCRVVVDRLDLRHLVRRQAHGLGQGVQLRLPLSLGPRTTHNIRALRKCRRAA